MELYPVILTGKTMEIRLEDHTLPAPPLSFTTGVTMKKNYYPGNFEPTVQVLNQKYSELEFSGKFMDLKAKESGFAEEMRNRLQDMKDLGEEVTLQYASQIFTGMIEEVTLSTYNIREIEYKIKFNVFWSDLRRIMPNKKNKPKKPDTKKMKDKVNKLKELVNKVKGISQKIKDATNKIHTAINDFKENIGLNDLNDLLSATNGVLGDLKNLRNEVRSISLSSFVDTTSLQAIGHNLDDLMGETVQLKKNIQSNQNPNQNNTIIYIVAKDDTLYTLAERFYGDSTDWWRISLANRLPNMQLAVGMRLVIPQ